MSHNVEHYEYDEKVNKAAVQKDLNTYVSHCTSHEGGHGIPNIRWNDVICDTYDMAVKWIESHDNGWYDCLAVKYKEPVQDNTRPAKLIELEQKVSEARAMYNQKSSVLYPKTRTSEYMSCQKCGSRLATKFLNTNYCPVCRTDLRPETTLKAIKAAQEKWTKAQNAKEEFIQKHSKKTIRWLVKIEYHT